MRDIVADAAFVNLLGSLPPEVAERLRQKYEADRSEFLQVVEDMVPSKEPKYWAKPSCTTCNGRGIIGTLVKPSGETSIPACSCTSKKYSKWLAEIRHFYNALKEQGHESKTAD